MKRLITQYRNISTNLQKYKFAIRVVTKGGKTKFYPVVKAPGFLSQWRNLVKVEEEVLIMDYEAPNGLTQEECVERIKAFKYQLEIAQEEINFKEEFKSVEEIEDQLAVDKW